jgi:hypothetical protein
VTAIQEALLVAVHEQLVPVTTDTVEAGLPVEGADALVKERAYEHSTAAVSTAAGLT